MKLLRVDTCEARIADTAKWMPKTSVKNTRATALTPMPTMPTTAKSSWPEDKNASPGCGYGAQAPGAICSNSPLPFDGWLGPADGSKFPEPRPIWASATQAGAETDQGLGTIR